MPPLIELKDICKYYPLVKANNKANLQVEKGEIHAIIGENGAGKSTLMNILYGMIKPDSGRIVIRGQHFPDWNTSIAIQQRIGMVHQSFKLIPPLTIAENIILGSEPTNGPLLRVKLAIKQIKILAKNLAPKITVNAVSPGFHATGVYKNDEELMKFTMKEGNVKTPLNRLGTVEDVVKVVSFLASPASDFITGHNFLVDGGIAEVGVPPNYLKSDI